MDLALAYNFQINTLDLRTANFAPMAISVAPPPGHTTGFSKTLRATAIASCKLRSTSLRTSLLAPRNKMVQVFGSTQSVMKDQYLRVSTLHLWLHTRHQSF